MEGQFYTPRGRVIVESFIFDHLTDGEPTVEQIQELSDTELMQLYEKVVARVALEAERAERDKAPEVAPEAKLISEEDENSPSEVHEGEADVDSEGEISTKEDSSDPEFAESESNSEPEDSETEED